MTGRSAAVGVAAALLALLVAAPGATSDLREGGTFRIGMGGGNFSPTIDPALPYSVSTAIVLKATCARLLSTPDKPLPAGYRLVPELAAEFPTVTNGGRTYTFRVRRGLRFSTGRRVTARDVAYSVNRVLRMDEVADSYADVVGAQAVRDGRAQAASGILARGDRLTVRLTRAVGNFAQRIGLECVLPVGTPADPEGVKAPVPAAGPYYVSEFVPGRRVVLVRNRFYGGERPHHVDRFVVDLSLDGPTVLNRVDRGQLDYGFVPTSDFSSRVEELRRKYGVGRSRFFVTPGTFLRMFVLNTERPLFRNNVRLRRAVNFAVDRKALLRERGPLAGYLTEQYLPPTFPGFRNEHIYPLKGPDLAKAITLARRRTRGGKAIVYVSSSAPGSIAQGQILRANLARIGLQVEIQAFPSLVLFEKLATRGEPFDIGWVGFEAGFPIPDPGSLLEIFEGRFIGTRENQNWSYFDSPRYNRLFAAASRLPIGPQRNAEYGRLDLHLTRNAAPAIAYAYDNVLTFVSARTGCVVTNAYLDLAAVCLK